MSPIKPKSHNQFFLNKINKKPSKIDCQRLFTVRIKSIQLKKRSKNQSFNQPDMNNSSTKTQTTSIIQCPTQSNKLKSAKSVLPVIKMTQAKVIDIRHQRSLVNRTKPQDLTKLTLNTITSYKLKSCILRNLQKKDTIASNPIF